MPREPYTEHGSGNNTDGNVNAADQPIRRLIVDDPVSAQAAVPAQESLDARVTTLEETGIGVDDQGNPVKITPDQVQTEGVEIGGITVGDTRTAFYAPQSGGEGGGSTVSVTTKQKTGTEIATVTVDGAATKLYAPKVVAAQNLATGTKIGSITIDGATTNFYAPAESGGGGGGGGGEVGAGPLPLLNQATLSEPVTSVIFSEDANHNTLNLTEGFYIEAEIELGTAIGEYVEIGNGQGTTKLISNTQKLSRGQQTYVRIVVHHVADGRWVCHNYTGETTYDSATGAGNEIGQVGFNAFADFGGAMNAAKIVYLCAKDGSFAAGSTVKIYGR